MADVRISVEDTGARLSLGRRVSSIQRKEVRHAVGVKTLSNIDEIFEQEGYPPRSWRLLNASTLIEQFTRRGKSSTTKRGRQRKPFLRFAAGKKILTDTARLRRSIQYRLAGSNRVEVGTSVIYARIHQEGGTIVPRRAKALRIPLGDGRVIFRKFVRIPARPFLLFRPQDQASLVEAAEAALEAFR
ncbi:MAG: hypothetical protein GC160_02920 [Acidobacteria bacterium]|nr:hypothetical protein [Acidobacteriota bacterium]